MALRPARIHDMKVAFVSLIAYDDLYRQAISEHVDDPDYFEEKILARHRDPVNKWCKALMGEDIPIEFWYLSYLTKYMKTTMHEFGHVLRRIPAWDLGTVMSRYLAAPWSQRLLQELTVQGITHVLLLNYQMNGRLPMDFADRVIMFCRKTSIKVIPVYGGGSIADYGYLKRKIKTFFLSRADGLLCQSQAELNYLVRGVGFPEEKAYYFSNPLDLENFQEIERATALSEAGLDGERRYILFIGRLVASKGVAHILKAMTTLAHQHQDLNLVIIGSGPVESDLCRQAKELGLEDRILFLGDVENKKLRFYYNAADALVLPSYSEGVPNVILEAIACGIPVVASAVGGIPNILSDGLGITVPPRDERALAEAIEETIEKGFKINQEKRRRVMAEIDLRAKGRELAGILADIDRSVVKITP